jgi:GNAT superfamily N-acetyltransferase
VDVIIENEEIIKFKFMTTDYFISTDKSKLDIEMIHDFLSNHSYWAQGRSIDDVRKSIKNSLCFGLYNNDRQQIGFGRVITDYTIFAWLLDVFILEEYRGLGLGKYLMTTIFDHKETQHVRRWRLATNDAHGLYEKFGFRLIKKPELFMERSLKL